MIGPLLLTRRWLGFTAVVVFAIVAFGLLSLWQWHRADDKRAQRIELASALAAAPEPLGRVLISGSTTVGTDEWRPVTVSGTYLAGTQVLVRKRPLDARNGFWVVTAMRADDGTAVWVNRGWLPTSGDALSTPDTPVPPDGPVAITGYLRPLEGSSPDANAGLPAGQIAAVSMPLLPEVGGAIPGYVQLSTSSPEQAGLVALPVPTVDESQNISYAVQWLLFAFVAVGGWFFFLRREAIEDARRTAPGDLTTMAGSGSN